MHIWVVVVVATGPFVTHKPEMKRTCCVCGWNFFFRWAEGKKNKKHTWRWFNIFSESYFSLYTHTHMDLFFLPPLGHYTW